jgi:hypothetical protein
MKVNGITKRIDWSFDDPADFQGAWDRTSTAIGIYPANWTDNPLKSPERVARNRQNP